MDAIKILEVAVVREHSCNDFDLVMSTSPHAWCYQEIFRCCGSIQKGM